MMKKNTVFALTQIILGILFSLHTRAQENAAIAYRFTHGPYLQELTTDHVFVYFTTSENGFSSVELREAGSDEITRHVTVDDGLIEANNTRNAIQLKGLKPNTKYEYRLFSTKIKQFRLSQNIYSDTIRTDWYGFTTVDPSATFTRFVTTSDIHDDADKYQRLLSNMPIEKNAGGIPAG